MKYILTCIIVFMLVAGNVYAQQPPAPQQAKIDDLVRLLQDPDIRTWLDQQKPQETDNTAPPPAQSPLTVWENSVRNRINAVISALPRVPVEVSAAAHRIREDATSHGYAPVLVVFAGLILLGTIAERLFRKQWTRSATTSAAMAEFLPLAVFTLAMAVVFFAIDWPPLARIVLLTYLIGFVVYRCLAVASGLAFADEDKAPLRRRVKVFLGVAIFAIVMASLGPVLSVDHAVRESISYGFSVVLLLIALECLWSAMRYARPAKIGLSLAIVGIWILWCLGLKGLFWLGVYALILPGILAAVGRGVEAMAIRKPGAEPNDTRTVLLTRGSRAIVIALAVGWIALVWSFNREAIARQDPAIRGFVFGVLKSVIILVAADLLWHLASAFIDRRLISSAAQASASPADAARAGRLRTLLPIFRNVLAVAVLVTTALIVLAQMGVEIGPLIAGAGIFGVALGFGSQTLVKDVISGVFYMLDDAFRVGEYIQSKSYKGTVESFSLRSVRLRHHRGPVYTVPFGELGAVENMSRDWGIDKFRITVGYDTDMEKARKLVKAIGAELQTDPEFGHLFISPLKMKGVEEFGDYGIVISFAMTTKPGPQTYIRRKAYAMIYDAFRKNGIEFAQPSVQVGGDDKSGAAAAATAVRQTQLKHQTPEG